MWLRVRQWLRGWQWAKARPARHETFRAAFARWQQGGDWRDRERRQRERPEPWLKSRPRRIEDDDGRWIRRS